MNILNTIGRTPLVKLKRIVPSGSADIWLKVECGNPTGSYKDRVALAMVEGAEKDKVFPRQLLECTGGSTGSSLAFVCASKGYPFTVISSDAFSDIKLNAMRAFGANVLVEPSVNGLITSDLWERMRSRASTLVKSGEYYWLDQFTNPYAPMGYTAMGKEILNDIDHIDAFCGAVGTGGMIVGVGDVLKKSFPKVRIVALEPDTSAVLSGHLAGSHGIDGTAAGYIPPLFDRGIVTEVKALPEQSAREMARLLAVKEGIFAGTSTGLNVLAALELAKEIGEGGVVVTVACDSGLKYLNGSLFNQ